MPQYHRVYPRFWQDMRGLPAETKLLGLYILSGRHRTTEGFYHLPVAYAAEDTELTPRQVRTGLAQLQERGFISYDAEQQIILIRKALSYPGQAPSTEKQVTGAMRAIEHLMPSPLWDEFANSARTHSPLLAEQIAKHIGIPFETHSAGDTV